MSNAFTIKLVPQGVAVQMSGLNVGMTISGGSGSSSADVYATGSILQNQINYINSQTGQFLTSGSAPGISSIKVTGTYLSGIITFVGLGGVTITSNGSTINFSGVSGISGSSSTGNYVDLTSNQTISGIKTFGNIVASTLSGNYLISPSLGKLYNTYSGPISPVFDWSNTSSILSGSSWGWTTNGIFGLDTITAYGTPSPTIIDVKNRYLWHAGGWSSLDWSNCLLWDNFGSHVLSIDWSNRVLYGNWNLLSGSLTISGNNLVDTISNQNISGRKTFLNDIRLSGIGVDIDVNSSGISSALQASGNIDSFYEVNIINLSTGLNASADIVVSNSFNESYNYVNMGINSQNYSGAMIGWTGDGYVYNLGGDFYIGNATSGRNLIIFNSGNVTGLSGGDIIITANGYIGIQNPQPQAQLDVKGSGIFSQGVWITGYPVLTTKSIIAGTNISLTQTGTTVTINSVSSMGSGISESLAIAYSIALGS
jgi:hypothetical protein